MMIAKASYVQSSYFGKAMSFNEHTYEQCAIIDPIDLDRDGWLSLLIYLRPKEIIRDSKIISILGHKRLLLVNTARKNIFVHLQKCGEFRMAFVFELGFVERKWQLFSVICHVRKKECELILDGRQLKLLDTTRGPMEGCYHTPSAIIGCHYEIADKGYWGYYFRGEIGKILVYRDKFGISDAKELYNECK
jgi:hypothetical protein